jgi:hypothetical protein
VWCGLGWAWGEMFEGAVWIGCGVGWVYGEVGVNGCISRVGVA